MTESDRLGGDVIALSGDEALLASLLRGATVVEAAKAAGMSEATARRRLRESEFKRRLDDVRRDASATLSAQLAGAAELGFETIRSLAADVEVPASVRRAAGKDLIELAHAHGEARDMEARLEALEDELAVLRDRAA